MNTNLKPNAVQLSPATDAWMSGDRYGAIVARYEDGTLTVRMDKSQKLYKVAPRDVYEEFSRA